MLVEARARELYYRMINEIISNEDFHFTIRTKRPPKDPINALISFENVYLYNRIATEINKTSLDIRIGFVHFTTNRSQSLNLDLADIFKPIIVDRVIFSLINVGYYLKGVDTTSLKRNKSNVTFNAFWIIPKVLNNY